MSTCPCQSDQNYEVCCEPFLKRSAKPSTAEQLMRSRYTAFVKADVAYLKETLAYESQKDFDLVEAKQWAESAKWNGLQILKTEQGQASDQKGVVEFIATYEMDGEALDHHEVSQFKRDTNGHWVFVSGDGHTHPAGETHSHHGYQKPQTHVREEPKIGRNDPCPCGSGKKYKKCCGQ